MQLKDSEVTMTTARQFYEQPPNFSVVPFQKDWPTMYDLPSEDPEGPGLPDEFHLFQPQLLSETLRLPMVSADQVFTGSDLNLYYDPNNKLWHKRPDWFAVAGVPRFYDGHDLRLSYVVWDEQVHPFIIVELLSPKTAKSDLGEDEAEPDESPTKWQVYEQILKVPYYVVFDRYEENLRVFKWVDGEYQPQVLTDGRYWLEDMGIGLGIWRGEFKKNTRLWLRWYDADGNWLPTETEDEREQRLAAQLRAESESRRADQERSRAERLAEKLRELGIDPDAV
jgi:Uma2 family endonuclease